jgi:hypothetical protein
MYSVRKEEEPWRWQGMMFGNNGGRTRAAGAGDEEAARITFREGEKRERKKRKRRQKAVSVQVRP